MPTHFNFYPYIAYDTADTNRRVLLTNIARRFVLRREILERRVLFEPYYVNDGDRPDTVAYKYYDDSQLDWLIMLANQIIHPQFDWYMSYQDFRNYIIKKYGDIETAFQTVHHYEKTVCDSYQLSNGLMSEKVILFVDSVTYHATPDNMRKQVSCYEWEDSENRKRQAIQLVHKSYAPQIVNEVKKLI